MKYIDPDTYKQQRVDAIRSMIYAHGMNLSDIYRRVGIHQSTIQRIISPYEKVQSKTVDRVYRLVYAIAPKAIDVDGPDYKDWCKPMMQVIFDYQDEMALSNKQISILTGLDSSMYPKYRNGDSYPRDKALWKAFCAVRNRITQMR